MGIESSRPTPQDNGREAEEVGVDTFRELAKYLLLMKIVAGQSLSNKDIEDNDSSGREDYREMEGHGEEGIIEALRAKGITAENNELVAGLFEYSKARRMRMDEIGATPVTSEMIEQKRQMTEDIKTARIKLNKLINKWEPSLTGGF